MLKIFSSDALHTANAKIIAFLKERRKNGGNHIVIVPDRFTLSGEKDVLRAIGEKGAFDTQVTSFKRLATQVLGNKAKKVLTSEGAVMLLSKVIAKNRDKLSFYAHASKTSGFASELYAVITAIRNNCHTTEDIREKIPEMPEYIQAKSQDIVLLYDEYLKELSNKRMDGSTLLQALTQEIPENDYISRSDLYIFDFFSFTAEQRRVIKALIKRAKSVNIALVKTGKENKNGRIYPAKEYERILALAKGESIQEDYTDSEMDDGRKRVIREMFSYSGNAQSTGGKGICIYQAETRDGELVHLARTIQKLVRDGYRYKDIAVLCGDVEGSLPSLKRIFSRHGVPFFADEKTILSTTPLYRFIKAAIIAGERRLTAENARELIKSPFSGLKVGEVLDFLNYVTKYSQNYIPTSKPFELGLECEYYKNAEKVRASVLNFRCNLKKTDTGAGYATEIENFLQNNEIAEKVLSLAKIQREIGDEFSASCSEQSYKKINSVLEQIKDVLGETELTREEFFHVLSSAAESVNISYTPMFVDNVYVGGASESRFTECKVLCVTGAIAGKLPVEGERVGILGESEERAFKRVGLDLSPTALESSLEEKLHLLQLVIMPKEKLFISYCAVDEEKRSDVVSDLISLFSDLSFETERTFYGDLAEQDEEKLKRAKDYLLSFRQVAEYAYAFSSFGEKLTKTLEKALKKGEKKNERREVLQVSDGKEAFFPKGRTSISQMEKYFRCPYSHYFSYGLGVRPVETGSSATLIGSFLHFVLEVGLKEYGEQGCPKVGGEKFQEIVKNAIEKALSNTDFEPLKSAKFKTIKERVIKEGEKALMQVAKFAEKSEYKPVAFEYSFGYDKEPFYIKGEKIKLVLTGKIDRIDKSQEKAVLLDYKTGGFPKGATDLYYGTGVQLVLYMSVFDKTGVETVGSFYYPLSNEYVKEGKSTTRLSGNILGSELSAFDNSMNPIVGKSAYLDVDFKDNGKPNTNAQETLLNEKELSALKEYSERVCAGAVDEMSDGVITPTPLADACNWCTFSVLCKGLKVYNRQKKTVKKDDVVKIILGEGGEERDV